MELYFLYFISAIFRCDLEWKTLPPIYEWPHERNKKTHQMVGGARAVLFQIRETSLCPLQEKSGGRSRRKSKTYNSLLLKTYIIVLNRLSSKKKKKLFNSEHILGQVLKIKRNFSLKSNRSFLTFFFFCHPILSW